MVIKRIIRGEEQVMKKKENTIPTERTEYDEALKNLKEASVRIELRRFGVDPYNLSRKDFDELKRLYTSMEQVDTVANGKITAIQQEAYQEKTKIGQEISEHLKKVLMEQHPMCMPPVPEMRPAEEQKGTGQEEPVKEPDVSR